MCTTHMNLWRSFISNHGMRHQSLAVMIYEFTFIIVINYSSDLLVSIYIIIRYL